MDLTDDDVLEIMKIFEQSKFSYLHLEHGGRHITLSKPGYRPAGAAALPTAAAPAPPNVPPPLAAKAASAGPAVPASEEPSDPALVPVTAPMMGVFYAAPSPSEPPFVQLGQHVSAEATLGLIEVMKVFASLKSDAPGVVERILVGNGQSVEVGQALFLIRPDTG
jgi:acetyl-CoA carboxylase biotin carboxyl carrier protein